MNVSLIYFRFVAHYKKARYDAQNIERFLE